MNSKFAFGLGLFIGASTGAVVSWRLLKKKYDQIINEEVASMREEIAAMRNAEPEKEATEEEVKSEPENEAVELPEEAASAMRRYDRTNDNIQKEGPIVMKKTPYVISPEEFGEFEDDGYECETLTLYADKLLAYLNDDIVEDIEGTVGDALDHFGEYDDDAVYVRNENLKTDFEILRCNEKYMDVYLRKAQAKAGEE